MVSVGGVTRAYSPLGSDSKSGVYCAIIYDLPDLAVWGIESNDPVIDCSCLQINPVDVLLSPY